MNKRAKKSLGQNFLSDRDVLESIVVFAGVEANDRVFEIGPGRGALTEHLLAKGAIVQALELDRDILTDLQERFQKNKNFTLSYGDILQNPLQKFYSDEEKYKVVANIPYYITAPIIRKLLTEKPAPQSLTLLVQKEVAERLAGGQKQRSILSVATHYYSDVKLGPVIPKTYFDPVPKVDSQLVSLFPKRAEESEDQFFFRVVRAGFAARRKTLFNNLLASRLGDRNQLEGIFLRLTWSLQRRAQELEVTEWQALTALLQPYHQEL